ncbi:MAG: NAD(P)-dependent oxidoreductase [Anaerolineales bacterium]|nr:NAD(P)-dependent oxidoreductase [Anaerolineales bacterium]
MPVPEGSEQVIDRKARMKLPYVEVKARLPEVRVRDFEPTFITMTPEEAIQAAERCIHCPDPAPCVEACLLHNDIPSAMWLVEQGDFTGAAEIYRQTSSMPEVCGRVCPHEALCQGACVRNKRGEPVITGALEAFVTSYQRENAPTKIPVGKSTGKKVAIVGSGPSGLACAEQLIRKGHSVSIFEAAPAPGGLLLYGIPNFKLSKNVVDAVVNDLKEAGAEFLLNTRIGEEKTVDSLLDDGYEAVYIGVGTGIDATMDVPGIELPGVYLATDFLIRANVDPDHLPEDKRGKLEIGKKVAVIGGGDTASDCLRSALRLGADEVTCLYRRTEAEMPGGKKDRELAKEEGSAYRFLTQPIRYIADLDGMVSAVECLQCELGEPDDSGRRRPIPIEGSNFTVPADTIVLALGYWPDASVGETTPELETRNWGLIVADADTGETSREGVYAGGDAVTGPNLVVTATLAGRQAAQSISEYLAK